MHTYESACTVGDNRSEKRRADNFRICFFFLSGCGCDESSNCVYVVFIFVSAGAFFFLPIQSGCLLIRRYWSQKCVKWLTMSAENRFTFSLEWFANAHTDRLYCARQKRLHSHSNMFTHIIICFCYCQTEIKWMITNKKIWRRKICKTEEHIKRIFNVAANKWSGKFEWNLF